MSTPSPVLFGSPPPPPTPPSTSTILPDPSSFTWEFKGQGPYEAAFIAACNLRAQILEYMTPEQRQRQFDRLDNFESFFDNLLAPLRNVVEKLHNVGK